MGWICWLGVSVIAAAVLPLAQSTAGADDRTLLQKGVNSYRMGDYEAAAEVFRGAVVSSPEDASRRAYLASALHMQGSFEEAEAEFIKAIQMAPDDVRYRSNLSAMYIEWGDLTHCNAGLRMLEELVDATGDPRGDLQDNLKAGKIVQMTYSIRTELRRTVLTHSDPPGTFFDLRGLCSGRNYTHKAELAFSQVLDDGMTSRATKLFPIEDYEHIKAGGLAFLRSCVQEAPDFAISAHLLSNQLEDKALALELKHDGGAFEAKTLRDEAAFVVSRTLPVAVPVAQQQQDLGDCPEKGSDSVGDCAGPGTGAGETVAVDDTAVAAAAAAAAGGGDEQDQRDDDVLLHVVTVATEFKEELKILQASAYTLGYELVILGLDEKWVGLGQKIKWLSEHLQDIPDHHVLLFVDAYDVVLLEEAREVVALYRGFGSALVFSGEVASSPDRGLQSLYPYGSGQGQQPSLPYLNSGTYIGTVGAVKAMLDEIQQDIEQHHSRWGADPLNLDDQRWFTRFYLRNRSLRRRIVLDGEGIIFHTLHEVAYEHFTVGPEAGQVHSKLTNSHPAALHGNGGSTAVFRKLVGDLSAGLWPKY